MTSVWSLARFHLYLAKHLLENRVVSQGLAQAATANQESPHLRWRTPLLLQVDPKTTTTTSVVERHKKLLWIEFKWTFGRGGDIQLRLASYVLLAESGKSGRFTQSKPLTQQDWERHCGALRVELNDTPADILALTVASALRKHPRLVEDTSSIHDADRIELVYEDLELSAPLGGDEEPDIVSELHPELLDSMLWNAQRSSPKEERITDATSLATTVSDQELLAAFEEWQSAAAERQQQHQPDVPEATTPALMPTISMPSDATSKPPVHASGSTSPQVSTTIKSSSPTTASAAPANGKRKEAPTTAAAKKTKKRIVRPAKRGIKKPRAFTYGGPEATTPALLTPATSMPSDALAATSKSSVHDSGSTSPQVPPTPATAESSSPKTASAAPSNGKDAPTTVATKNTKKRIVRPAKRGIKKPKAFAYGSK